MKTERTRIIGEVDVYEPGWLTFLKGLALVLVNVIMATMLYYGIQIKSTIDEYLEAVQNKTRSLIEYNDRF